jgi:uncharacterized protein YxjI
MIEVYIPRKKFYFNQNHTIISPEGLVLYEHKSSFFQGKLSLFQDHQLIYTSDQFFSFFKRRYDIKRHQETLCKVTEKWKFFSEQFIIETEMGNYAIIGKVYREDFQIYDGNQLVLSIKRDERKIHHRIIQVDEVKTGFLLMLMFTVITMSQQDSTT